MGRPFPAILAALLAPTLCAADWQAAGPFGGTVISIAVDGPTLLAGARNGQLFRSLDGAATWSQVSFGTHLVGSVRAIALDGSHYWIGVSGESAASNGLWESRDAGSTWTHSLAGLGVESIARHGTRVAAGTRHGLYLTTDGAQWTRITPERHPDLEDIVSLAFDPRDARSLYAGTPHLPWKTSDGGATWQPIRAGMIDDSDVFSIHVSATDPSRVFASACSGIYRSENSGARWKLLDGIPRTSRRTHVIAQQPGHPNVVFAGTTDGLFRSTDGGASWTRLNSLAIHGIAFGEANTLYLATEHAGVQKSGDAGKTVQSANQGLSARNVAATASFGSLQFLSTTYEGTQGGVFIQSAAGWRKVGGTSFANTNVRSLTSDGERLLAGAGDRLLESKDGGKIWKPLRAQPPGHGVMAVMAGKEVWAGTDRGLFHFVGNVWRRTPTSGPVQGMQFNGSHAVAWTNTGALTSKDRGKSWRAFPVPSVFDAAISCQGQTVFATSTGLRAEAGGIGDLPEGTVSAVAFHPLRCREVYAAQFGRLFRSMDAGAHWSPVEGATTLPLISKLWVSGTGEDLLYATVPGSGLFRIDVRP